MRITPVANYGASIPALRGVSIADRAKAAAGRFEVDLGIVHHMTPDLIAKEMHLPKGYEAFSHSHSYDHLSILGQGKALVKTDDSEQVYTAPACIEIKKGVHHSITALEDVTWYCIHATAAAEAADIVHIGEAR